MANTTNYNWETPDDTDLVKDGAAAIRTLGNSIDTTTKNLNPETTTGDIAYRSATANTNTRLAIGSSGQVLTVAAGVPSWATPTDQTPLTTKGDVFTFSTLDARLGVGANGTVLTADSAETTGLKWAAPASISWTTWSPSYSNLTIGNGTVVARYAYSGGLVILEYQLTWGSTSSFTGNPTIGNLPYNPKNRGAAIGHLQAANVNRPWFVSWAAAASSIQLYAFTTDSTYAGQAALSNSIPGSWSSVSEDYLGIYAVYEAN